tara:strand:- start:539 stop:778 length:240 start_codon:yes stop_codon:yes gene_type:complete
MKPFKKGFSTKFFNKGFSTKVFQQRHFQQKVSHQTVPSVLNDEDGDGGFHAIVQPMSVRLLNADNQLSVVPANQSNRKK